MVTHLFALQHEAFCKHTTTEPGWRRRCLSVTRNGHVHFERVDAVAFAACDKYAHITWYGVLSNQANTPKKQMFLLHFGEHEKRERGSSSLFKKKKKKKKKKTTNQMV